MLIETIQRVLAIVASLSVTLGVIVALQQLRNQNRLRQIDTVMRLYSTFGQESFLRHFNRVLSWNYRTYEAFHKRRNRDDQVSLQVVEVFFENMGLLYKRNLAPLDLMDDLLSGPILRTWQKVGPILVGLREELGQPQGAEWFEFLHHAMVERLARLARGNKRQANRHA